MEKKTAISEFEKDVLDGLSAQKKHLSSKYFYDERGSKIFQDIMQMPEYYLTDCELEIFQTQKQEILDEFADGQNHFELVELGAGDGMKTKILLSHFLNCSANFDYAPIDISEEAMKNLVTELKHELPGLRVNELIGDYFHLIKNLHNNDGVKKIILFLGSNIGNFNEQKSLNFLNHLRHVLNPQDQVLIGFDLKKDPEVILKAYNDPHGHTSAFNLNLLRRINDELGANFTINSFKHHEVYNPQTGSAKSFLISQINQEVNIPELDRTFSFKKWEPIYMERSQKYDLEMIENLADKSGFEIVRNFHDKRQYFVNSLWKLKAK